MAAQLRACCLHASRPTGAEAEGGSRRARSSSNPLPRPFTPTCACHRPARAASRLNRGDVFAQVRPEPAATGQIRYLQTRARIRAASQRPEDALEDLFACGRLEREWEIRTPAFAPGVLDAAPLLASVDRRSTRLVRARARGSSSAAAPSAHKLRSARPSRRLAFSSGGDTGIELPEQAVAHPPKRSPARLEHALALVELGAAIPPRRRRADARGQPPRRRSSWPVSCGAEAVAARAHDELVSSGCPPSSRPHREPQQPHCLGAPRRAIWPPKE